MKYSLFARPKQVYEGGLSNISGAGIYIHCKKTYPVRTRLNLEIELPDISEPVKVSAAVSWNADKEIQPHDYPGMGVEFTDISYEEQKELLEFIVKNTSSRSGRGRR